jgi:hypothetical protein
MILQYMGPVMTWAPLAAGAVLILLFIFNLALAKYVHRDAIARNHPHAEFWAIVTLFFSLLALIVYVTLRGDYQEHAEKTRRVELPPPAVVVRIPEPIAVPKQVHFCPSCGVQSKPGANFCFKCGASLS